jgi:hypothetical protein
MEPTNQIEKEREKEKETNDGITLKLSTIDDVTLEFMVNTAQYEKYLRKNNIEFDSGFKRDLRFYRKRIISLTKDLFKSKNENGDDQSGNIDITMVGAFNMYMRACISYLKFSDQSETIQKCYVCLGIPNENDDVKKCICKNNRENNDNELNHANALCFKPKDVKKVTLDNYIIRKNVKKAEPIVYPQQFTFNPKDPSFKYKGLKSKPSSIQAPQQLQTLQQAEATQVKEKEEDKINTNVNTNVNTNTMNRENGEKDEIIREKIKGKKDKNNKNKKVSFDITNYVNNI